MFLRLYLLIFGLTELILKLQCVVETFPPKTSFTQCDKIFSIGGQDLVIKWNGGGGAFFFVWEHFIAIVHKKQKIRHKKILRYANKLLQHTKYNSNKRRKKIPPHSLSLSLFIVNVIVDVLPSNRSDLNLLALGSHCNRRILRPHPTRFRGLNIPDRKR